MARSIEMNENDLPYHLQIPGTALIGGFAPTLVVMLQLWQLMDFVNGPANIHSLHVMLYIIFVLFLVVVVEVALINNYMVLSM